MPKQVKASAISHFLETQVMEALERERPSAGSNGFCVKSVLLQEKTSAFWGLETGKAGLLVIEQGSTAKAGYCTSRMGASYPSCISPPSQS